MQVLFHANRKEKKRKFGLQQQRQRRGAFPWKPTFPRYDEILTYFPVLKSTIGISFQPYFLQPSSS
jgi:hypothetical protein